MKIRGQRVIPYEERLMSYVSKDEDGCWNWTGTVRSSKSPYGRLMIGSRSDHSRRSIGAHQLSYLTFVGPIPPGLAVCHKCDNPRCINPEHLFVGTWKENADDRDAKGRNVPAPILRGESSPWSKLTDQQVAEIRNSQLSSRAIAKEYGLSDSYVRQLRRKVSRTPPARSGRLAPSLTGMDWKLSGVDCPNCRGDGRIGMVACTSCGATGRTVAPPVPAVHAGGGEDESTP